jgi:peptidoglycan hydrolase-like protein with peptidoglycan-binding domain
MQPCSSSCGRYVAGGWVGGEPAGPAVAVAPTSTLAATAQPTLRMGSRGAAVVSLQRRLATLRYDVGPVDGVFGSSTHHGVVAFQKVNGLVP